MGLTPTPKNTTRELSRKVELHNHIVSMRKYVQQAKVHVINHLTKELNLLKNRKGAEKVVQKAQRKAERLLSEVKVLKVVKKDEVALFALQNALTLKEILENPQVEIETKVKGRLALHPSVVSHVQKYREKYPHWALQIPVLLEKSKLKEKKAEKKAQKTNPVSNNNLDLNLELIDKDTLDADEEKSELEEEIPAKKSKIVDKKQPINNQKKETKNSKVLKTSKVLFLKSLSDLEENSTENLDQNSESDSESESEKDSKIDENLTKKRPKSSFFIGGVDEEAEFEKEEPSKVEKKIVNHSEFKPIFRKGKLVNKLPSRRERRAVLFNREIKKPKNSSTRTEVSNNQQNPSFNQPKVGTDSNSVGEKLHPSWEAKKKLTQVSIAPFKGKKIVFDD